MQRHYGVSSSTRICFSLSVTLIFKGKASRRACAIYAIPHLYVKKEGPTKNVPLTKNLNPIKLTINMLESEEERARKLLYVQ